MRNFFCCFLMILIVLPLLGCQSQPDEAAVKPNFLLIVADDMGWTDLGRFGSEIQTPNLDTLAKEGVSFTDFHVSMSCSPTRSMLLTGTDNHIAGLGTMAELLTEELAGVPGYEGHLNDRVVTVAEVLREEGYHTYMAGKWHLGHDAGHYPFDRGFERSISMLYGGASYWSDMSGVLARVQEVAKYVLDGEELKSLPRDFYATRSYTDYLMDFIRENRDDGKPFLAYLAFTAPHDPLHVPEPWRSKYKGQYDEGYAALKSGRSQGARQAGVLSSRIEPASLHPMAAAWDSLTPEQKTYESRAMEVYAGMVDNMDYNVGRIIRFLKDINEYDNTIIIFMSDNGSNPLTNADYSPGEAGRKFLAKFDNSLDSLGSPKSHYAYGVGWGSACSGPLDFFKMTVGEGGIRSPMIISGPGVIGGRQVDAFSYVTDIMPTILELADLAHPEEFRGRRVEPMRGYSITGLLSGARENVYANDEYVGGEMGANKWMRQGDYKAIYVPGPYGPEHWRLFNVVEDPGETTDLSKEKPKLLARLKAAWDQYADDVGVVPVAAGMDVLN
nr:arylsulfatase [Pseudodesulfovibrio sp.]